MPERDLVEDLPLGHWIKRAFLALTGHMNDLLRPHDLTYSQWQVLSFVARVLITSGMRASSIRRLSASSTTAKCRPRCTASVCEVARSFSALPA